MKGINAAHDAAMSALAERLAAEQHRAMMDDTKKMDETVIYLRAAHIVNTKGWSCRWPCGDLKGRVSLRGAVAAALGFGVIPYYDLVWGGPGPMPDYRPYYRRLREFTSDRNLKRWEHAKSRTKDDIISVLRRAAEAARSAA